MRLGVPLDAGDDPPVLVGGDLADSATLTQYAESVDVFAYSWAWDQVLLGRALVIQAQAAELDAGTESFLSERFTHQPATWGWPCRRNLRFGADDGTRVLLWDGPGQCDWLVSGPDADAVERWVHALLDHSDLRSSFWSGDAEGAALLARVRASS